MKNKIKTILATLDVKFQGLIPNPKLRKILYYSVGGLFGFMLLLILLGLLLSPLKKRGNSNDFPLIKPKVEVASPSPKKELNEAQKQILNLESKIKDLKFPESILTMPTIENNLTI